MNEVASPQFWRKCSSCKKEIGYRASYFVCSVSTCTRKRVGYVFCSVHCWERHLPGARHRDAAAIEATSPTFEEWRRELESDSGSASSTGAPSPSASAPISADRSPQRVIVRTGATPGTPPVSKNDPLEQEILIVATKLKAYIRAKSEMNTSDAVMETLSRKLRRLCDQAIDHARSEGRKTVMERDFES